MITIRNVRKTLGGKIILNKVNFSIGKGQKIALVGPNGVGKSTLLKILAGIESADRGEIEMPKRALVGYLPQEPALSDSQEGTVLEFLREATGVGRIEWRMKLLESRLDDKDALFEYDRLAEDLRRITQFSFEDRVRRMLDGLFLRHIELDRPFRTLSGGERAKVNLAAVILSGADILFLDEPTNNLDLPALLFLERYLAESDATILIASHDRKFLDAIVTKVFEIEWFSRGIEAWAGNWSTYWKNREEKRLHEKELYEKEQKEKLRLRDSSDTKKEWARIGGEMVMPDKDKMSQGYHRNRSERKHGATAKALATRSVKSEKTKLPLERNPFHLYFNVSTIKQATLALKKAVAGYTSGFTIGPVSFQVKFGSRIAFLGLNGSGKSTLLKSIAGVSPLLSGEIVRGENIRIGEFDQLQSNLPFAKTAIEWFLAETLFETNGEVGIFLREFQFDPETIDAPIGRLSPGERARLSIAMMVAQGMNTLLLDEPTNHLDTEAVMALEDALEKYPGTIILVSHDRAFLDRTKIDTAYLFEGNSVRKISDREAYIANLEASADKQATNFLRRIGKI